MDRVRLVQVGCSKPVFAAGLMFVKSQCFINGGDHPAEHERFSLGLFRTDRLPQLFICLGIF